MTSHRPHPITGPWPYVLRADFDPEEPVKLSDREPTDDSIIYDDPDDALLFDGCDRCEQHARNVWLGSVDDSKLAQLWQRMIAVERSGDESVQYRTVAEATACRTLYDIACFVAYTHPGIDPWSWPWTRQAVGNLGEHVRESLAGELTIELTADLSMLER